MKKIYLLSFTFLFITSINSFAVPAYPYPIDITQPDGTTLTITLKGDEFVSWAESPDGYTLLRNPDGFYEYAQKNAQGDLALSGRIAKNVEQRTADDNIFLQQIPQKLTFSSSQAEAFRQIREMRQQAIERAPQRAFTGTIRAPLILVQFPGKPFTKTTTDFQLLCNQQNYSLGTATGSVYDYFWASSYKQLDFQVDVFGPYTLAHPISYYDKSAGGNNGNTSQTVTIISEATTLAQGDGCNFANYDDNNDGKVDGVHLIYAGYDQSAGAPEGNSIWASAWSTTGVFCTRNGKTISKFSMSSELRGTSGTTITPIGVICHELSHVFGLPDLYDTDYSGSGGQSIHIDKWCIMASGSWNNNGDTPPYHSAWCRDKLGWATAIELTSPADITIPNPANVTDPATQGTIYKITTTTPKEYFLLENRQKQNWDNYVPSSGLLIYHVDENAGTTDVFGWKNINVNPAHRGLYIKQAGGGAGSTSTNRALDPYPQGTNNLFTDTSVPNSKSWAGANTAKPVTDIVQNTTQRTITFKFMGGGPLIPPPTVITQAATNVNCNSATLNRSVTAGAETISAQGFEYRASGASTWIIPASENLTGLTTGIIYEFRAYATTASGTTYGSTLTFTAAPTKTQTIDFPAIATKTYGDAAITLPTTSSAGLTIYYQSSNTAVAIVSGNTLTIVGAGISSITASQNGDCDYTAAASVAQRLTVTKASLTVTADNKSREYGAANPAFTLSFDGFKNDENENVLDQLPTISCDANATSPVGFYDIVLSGGTDNDYEYTLVNGVLEVTTKTNNDNVIPKSISIYPNPVTSELRVKSEELRVNDVKIFDITGRNLDTHYLILDTDYLILDTNSLPKGIYFIKIELENSKTVFEKFIKE